MLPRSVQQLFKPALPPKYIEPNTPAPEKRGTRAISGISQYLVQVGKDTDYVPTKTLLQEQREKRKEKKERHLEDLNSQLAKWKPREDPHIIGDEYCTVFIGRLRYSVDETALQREFTKFGTIERVRVVKDSQNRSRGYGFVVFENEQQAKTARKEANNMLLEGRRIVTDITRGRSTSWRPRRLGGGREGRQSLREKFEQAQRQRKHTPDAQAQSFSRKRQRPDSDSRSDNRPNNRFRDQKERRFEADRPRRNYGDSSNYDYRRGDRERIGRPYQYDDHRDSRRDSDMARPPPTGYNQTQRPSVSASGSTEDPRGRTLRKY